MENSKHEGRVHVKNFVPVAPRSAHQYHHILQQKITNKQQSMRLRNTRTTVRFLMIIVAAKGELQTASF